MQKSALLLLAFVARASSLVATPALSRASTLAAPLVAPLTAPLTAPLARARPVVAADTVIEPDYKLAAGALVLGPALIVAPYLFGGFVTLLGVLFIVQTLRIRFVFDDEAFEVKTLDLSEGLDGALGDTGENFAVGGENRWAYSSFVNWEFFPTQSFPILVYFKETATPQDKWAVGPGQFANSDDALAKGAVQGQVHFFPCIGNADQLRDEFIKNGCAKL